LPLLEHKSCDPAVVVDEAGRFVISLCSGHQGGAEAGTADCPADREQTEPELQLLWGSPVWICWAFLVGTKVKAIGLG